MYKQENICLNFYCHIWRYNWKPYASYLTLYGTHIWHGYSQLERTWVVCWWELNWRRQNQTMNGRWILSSGPYYVHGTLPHVPWWRMPEVKTFFVNLAAH